MYILKRSWYYITRKKGKSITIGIILFVVATLVLTGLLINSAANKTFQVAKNKLGSNIIYKSDTSSVIEDAMGNNTNEGGRFNPVNITLPDDYTNLTTKEVETIAENSKYVKSYKYSTSYTGNPIGFEEYSLTSSDESETEDNSNNDNTLLNDKKMNMASLSIIGVSEESDAINSTNSLVEGTFFTEAQINNGENIIIVEKKLAELNELSVGDEISIEQVVMKRGKGIDSDSDADAASIETTYTIVGIYETSNATDLSNENYGMAINNAENTMYVPYTSILKMQENGLSDKERAVLEENGYTIESVTFIIDDPDNSDAFISEVENMEDIDLTYRSLSIDNEAYQKMVGNIESVASTAKILVTIVVIAGAFIIMLISMLTIKDRKYEIGVLLSLGESKIKVLFQLISEILIIGVISFTLSTLATSIFAQKITNYLLNNEVSTVETIDMNNVSQGNYNTKNNRGNSDFGGREKFNMSKPDTTNLDIETIDELTITLTPLSVLSLYGVGLLIIIIGNMVQAIFVLKLNPKEIMLDR